MSKHEIAPQHREHYLKPEHGKTLQSQVDEAIDLGVQRIILEGIFTEQNTTPFSLLTVTHDLELIGQGQATFDGQHKINHILFVADGVKVKMRGLRFVNGTTDASSSQRSLDNHPQSRINIFRYIDGGAISVGLGAEVIMEDCHFEGNHSAICGGAISNVGGYVQATNCHFIHNSCGDTGAAIDNLAAGSLTIIDHCQFRNNQANKLGQGTYGAITAFSNTYLIINDSDFTGETTTAVDYRPNKHGEVWVAIDKRTTFNPDNPNAILKNPASNPTVKIKIAQRYAKLLMKHPGLVKLQGIPTIHKATREKHRKLFEKHYATTHKLPSQ